MSAIRRLTVRTASSMERLRYGLGISVLRAPTTWVSRKSPIHGDGMFANIPLKPLTKFAIESKWANDSGITF